MARRSLEELRERALGWVAALQGAAMSVRVVEVVSVTGGGTFAGEEMPSVALAIDTSVADSLLGWLRMAESPVVARIKDGAVLCDARTVLPDEDETLLASLRWAMGRAAVGPPDPQS
jgi:L-seryl-tRNA(Ser) seleniumtransferase